MRRSDGFTILELLVVLAIVGILFTLSIIYLNKLPNLAKENAQRVGGLLNQARSKALVSTGAVRLNLASSGGISTVSLSKAVNCSDTDSAWIILPDSIIELEKNVSITDSRSVPLCFSSRGYANIDHTYTFTNLGSTRVPASVSVYLGGAVRIQ